jgi:ATP-binding cassette subfamily B protein
MIKTLKYGLYALKLAVAANGAYAIVYQLSQIYENTLFPLLQIFLLAKLLDLFIAQRNIVPADLYGIAAIYLIASLVRIYFKHSNSMNETTSQMKQFDYLDLITQEKLSKLDPAVFERPEFQDLLGQMNDIRQNVGEFLTRFTTLIDRVVKTVTASIVLAGHFAFFIPLLTIAVVPSFLILYRFRTKIFPPTYEERSLLGRVSNYIRGLLAQDSASKEIAIFRNGDELVSKISDMRHDYIKRLQKQMDDNHRYKFLAELFQLAIFLFTQVINLSAVLTKQITIGQFSLYFQQTQTLMSGVDGILDHYSGSYMRVKYMEKLEEFLNYPAAIQSPEKPEKIPEDPSPPTIELINVSFKYPNTERFILKDFNLKLESGEKIALVGENGAGKTTLIKLILRFYDPTEG